MTIAIKLKDKIFDIYIDSDNQIIMVLWRLVRCVSERCKLLKNWKKRNTSKEKYLEAKKKTWRAVYQASCREEGKRFGNVMGKDDQKCNMFKNAK